MTLAPVVTLAALAARVEALRRAADLELAAERTGEAAPPLALAPPDAPPLPPPGRAASTGPAPTSSAPLGREDGPLAGLPASAPGDPVRLPVVGPRPVTRGECAELPRPCPHVGCRWHLPPASAESCVLDVSDQGGVTLEVVGELLGLTRERVRQIEAQALGKVRRAMRALEPPSLRDEEGRWW